MSILKSDAKIVGLEALLSTRCPICEEAIGWSPSGDLATEYTAEHPSCGLRFCLVVESFRGLVMDSHGRILDEAPHGDSIALRPRPSPPETPCPGPRFPTVNLGGTEALDVTGPGSLPQE